MKLGIYTIRKCNFEHMDDKIEIVHPSGFVVAEISYNERDKLLSLSQQIQAIDGKDILKIKSINGK